MTRRFAALALTSIALLAACSVATPTLEPIASPGPSAAVSASQGPGTPHGSQTPSSPAASHAAQLIVENRGGEAFNVTIGGTVVATAACGQVVVIAPGVNNFPALPWDLAVVRASDGATVVASRV